MNGKKLLGIVVVLLLLGGGVVTWRVFKSKPAKAPNQPPIAVLRLDSLDETNRSVTLSDGGSRDPDGTLQSWRIAWGDGKEETFTAIPQKAAHTYADEGDYKISLSCVDDLGATSSQAATTNITFDYNKRQLLLQAEANRQAEAKRLQEEQARKEAERLEQEKALAAAEDARKAKERAEQEAKDQAEAERSRQIAREALAALNAVPPDPLAKELPDKATNPQVIYTPRGFMLGQFQILKEKVEGTATNGNALVVLAIRCVNFPVTPIVTSNWQIDGQDFEIQGGRIRASLSPGEHAIIAHPRGKEGLVPVEIKATATVQPNGECIIAQAK